MGEMTDAEMRAFAERHGLRGLAPEEIGRMRELAGRVVATGLAVPRMAEKADEPAGVFAVPLPPQR
jgi:hypothetical protein